MKSCQTRRPRASQALVEARGLVAAAAPDADQVGVGVGGGLEQRVGLGVGDAAGERVGRDPVAPRAKTSRPLTRSLKLRPTASGSETRRTSRRASGKWRVRPRPVRRARGPAARRAGRPPELRDRVWRARRGRRRSRARSRRRRSRRPAEGDVQAALSAAKPWRDLDVEGDAAVAWLWRMVTRRSALAGRRDRRGRRRRAGRARCSSPSRSRTAACAACCHSGSCSCRCCRAPGKRCRACSSSAARGAERTVTSIAFSPCDQGVGEREDERRGTRSDCRRARARSAGASATVSSMSIASVQGPSPPGSSKLRAERPVAVGDPAHGVLVATEVRVGDDAGVEESAMDVAGQRIGTVISPPSSESVQGPDRSRMVLRGRSSRGAARSRGRRARPW